MPRKKGESSPLGLPALPPLSGSTTTSLVPYPENTAMTVREQQIAVTVREHEHLIYGKTHKTKFGIEQMNDAKVFGVSDLCRVMQELEAIKQEAAGTSYQEAVEELNLYMTRLAVRHTLGAIEVSASKIAQVISYSIEPPPPPPEKPKGLLARLFGG